jgi:hypothetical protein
LGELLPEDARHDIGPAAGRERHDHAHGARRILVGAERRRGEQNDQDADELAHRFSF